MTAAYDLLVIGGGPGGAIAAKTASENGLKTCLVEKRSAIGTTGKMCRRYRQGSII